MAAPSKRAGRADPAEPAGPAASGEPAAIPALRRRIRADLRRRGVPAALAAPIAERIAPRADGLDDVRYAVLLDGAAAAHTVQPAAADAAEVRRLVQDFAIELKKLDEGLRLLSTYLLRIRDRTDEGRRRTVH